SALFGAALAYSYMLFMGFFNFVLGAALFAFTVGFWWRRRNDRYVIVLYALLIATYLSHALAYAATLMALGVLALLERRWRLFVVYFVAPWGYGAAGWVQGGWINDRLLFLAVLTLPAWLTVPRPVLATALATVAILVHFGVTTVEIARFHRQIGDITRAAALV